MNGTPDIVTGDSIVLAVTLKKNSAVFEIASDAEVKVALVSTDHQTAYTEPIEQSSTTPGADWDLSLVIVELPPAATQEITYQGLAIMEIQVTEGTENKTWFLPVKIITGQIT